jgi:hypothetical protein
VGRRVVETIDLRSAVRVVIAVSLALWAIALVTIIALYVLAAVIVLLYNTLTPIIGGVELSSKDH